VRAGQLSVVREEDQVYNDVKGVKEKSEGKKVNQFLEIYICERDLYLILSFILSQWRDLWIGVMW